MAREPEFVVPAIPLGSFPRDALDLVWLGAAGAAVGALAGAVLGVWAAGAGPR